MRRPTGFEYHVKNVARVLHDVANDGMNEDDEIIPRRRKE